MKGDSGSSHYKYLIIGGGMTADSAVHGIREIDQTGAIGVIGSERHPAYNRPPLSKALWKGKPLESIWRPLETLGVEYHLGRTVLDLDPLHKRVDDDQDRSFTFDKALLATGGTARRLQFPDEGVIYFRSLDDFQRLRERAQPGCHFAVIGGGFIGSEIAAALAMNGVQVTLAFPDEGIGARIYPRDLSLFLNDYFREKEVTVLCRETASAMEKQGDRFILTTQGSRTIESDGVVAGIGIVPNVELAEKSDLPVHNGILVDERLRAGNPDVYAAGDVASFFNPALGQRIRVEHEDNANSMGRAAGRSMAGSVDPYHHLPFFYSDLFDLGYEAVGELDSRLEMVADWKEPYREGVIYYLRDGRVRGVLLWNVWNQVEAARHLIADPGPFTAKDLKGRLPAG